MIWEKKETAMKNIVRRNDVFDTQHFQDFLKISKNYNNYGTSDREKKNWTKITKTVENKRYHLRSENDEKLDSIEPRKATEIQLNSRQKEV